jgi:hypothetical protein
MTWAVAGAHVALRAGVPPARLHAAAADSAEDQASEEERVGVPTVVSRSGFSSTDRT